MATKIRNRRRARRQTVLDPGGLFDLSYEEVLADLDPGMLTWQASDTGDGVSAAAA